MHNNGVIDGGIDACNQEKQWIQWSAYQMQIRKIYTVTKDIDLQKLQRYYKIYKIYNITKYYININETPGKLRWAVNNV